MSLKDKVAIITGAGQGIGEGYAKGLAERGCKIVVADINEAQGQRVAADQESFSTLVVGTQQHPGMGLVGIIEMFGRITERHTQRMHDLGLSA